MLHLLGIDHKKLTYRFNGRDMRLTDVYGTLIPQIVKADARSAASGLETVAVRCRAELQLRREAALKSRPTHLADRRLRRVRVADQPDPRCGRR